MVIYVNMGDEEYEPMLNGDDVLAYPNRNYWIRLDCGTIELFNSNKGLDIIAEYEDRLIFSCKTNIYTIMKQHISMLTVEYEEE